MPSAVRPLPRLRQAVLIASELESVTAHLRDELSLGEPFSDPTVGFFGLRNAVFALGDTFLEVVSPVQEGTAAGRWLSQRGGDGGYMVMFEVDDLQAARERAAGQHAREVFQVERTWQRSTFILRTCAARSWRSACRCRADRGDGADPAGGRAAVRCG